jgi:hypothetical protein
MENIMGILDGVVKNLKNQVETNVSNMFKGMSQQKEEPEQPAVFQTNTATEPQASAPQAVNASFCPQCGTRVEAGGRFCPSCGTAIAVPPLPAQPASQAAPPPPPAPENPAPAVESASSMVKKYRANLESATVNLARAAINPEGRQLTKGQLKLLDRFIQALMRDGLFESEIE